MTKNRALRFVLAIVICVLLLFAAYTAFALNWAYSDGERAGVIQKFSRKGWLFKTWEGELAMTTVPGVAPVTWRFSVRDDEVAKSVSAAVGRRVVLHYTEHRGVPTRIFGETPHFVNGVRETTAPELP
jgi:hypothetical protein